MLNFNMFKPKQDFRVLFPAISPYFHNKDDQKKILDNKSFIDKYERHSNLIEYFMLEIEKYYEDDNEKRNIINKYIIGLNDEMLVDLINTYLGLPENDRKSKKFFQYYDQKHDLVDVSKEELIEIKKLDTTFNQLYGCFKSEGEQLLFNNVDVKDLYNSLDLSSKRYFVSVFKKKSYYQGFIKLFENRYRIYFKSLIKILMDKSIDPVILNIKIDNFHGLTHHRKLVYTLMTNSNTEIARYVKELLCKGRFDVLDGMISKNLISDVPFGAAFIKSNDKELSYIDIIKEYDKVRKNHYYNN